MKDREAIGKGLSDFLRELEHILEKRIPSGNYCLVGTEIKEWKSRVVVYLRGKVSEEEAGKLESMPFVDLPGNRRSSLELTAQGYIQLLSDLIHRNR